MRRRTAKAPPRTFHLCPLTIVEDPQPRSAKDPLEMFFFTQNSLVQQLELMLKSSVATK